MHCCCAGGEIVKGVVVAAIEVPSESAAVIPAGVNNGIMKFGYYIDVVHVAGSTMALQLGPLDVVIADAATKRGKGGLTKILLPP